MLLVALLSTASASGLPVGPIAPVVIPQAPSPNWNWDSIPQSFHGAVKDRAFNAAETAHLAKYDMVTTEKWYTPCGSAGPTQSGPSCGVEFKIEDLFKDIKAISPNTTTIMYWNSMFDFAFYSAHQKMLDLEARNVPVFLRDETGKVISLCNDGDVYCNITQYDWTQPAAREVWVEAVTNMTATGVVDGIFADHSANEGSNIGTVADGQLPNQLCNGKGAGRMCYNFTDSFKASFNSWHLWATNYTQDLLSKTTGGPVIQGPIASMNGVLPIGGGYAVNYCDFTSIRQAQETSGYSVLEARGECKPSCKCMAAYLAAVEQGTYMHCLYNSDDLVNQTYFPEMDYSLGAPRGPAVEGKGRKGKEVWTRSFASGTTVQWDDKQGTGSIKWSNGKTCGDVF